MSEYSDPMDLSREVAEKILRRAMAPLREFLDSERNTKEISVEESVSLTVAQIREIDRDLGAIGLAMATRYREQVEFRTALAVMSAENVRLNVTIETLSELAEKYRAEGETLADALQKTRTVNSKLKELRIEGEKPAFRSSSA